MQKGADRSRRRNGKRLSSGLREKGLAAAAKKAGRIAAEGMVAGYVSGDAKIGVIVEVNCETDFVANTDNFKDFCKKIAHHIAKANPADVDTLMGQQFADDTSKTITDLVSDATVAIGEKISVRRFARYEAKAARGGNLHPHGRQNRRAPRGG